MVSVTHQEALADYAGFGAERSLAKLRRHYQEKGVRKPPSLKTLSNWSARYGWVAVVENHDRIVGEKLLAEAQRKAVECGFDRVEALVRVAQSCLDSVLEFRASDEGLTPQDVKALVSTAIDAIKAIELLGGGVTERREEYSGGIAAEALQILREIEAEKRAGLPVRVPPAMEETTARR